MLAACMRGADLQTSERVDVHPDAAPSLGPSSPALAPGDPLFSLARRALTGEFRTLRAQLHHGQLPTPEQIHEARIAIRRIRVALRLFRDFLPAQARHFRDEFGSLGRALGAIRELDVLESVAEQITDSAMRAEFRQSIGSARDDASGRLSGLLSTDRFALLFGQFSDFVGREPSLAVKRRWRSLRIHDAARADVGRTLRAVLKRGRKISAETSPDTLHRLRIQAKHLRYEAEFYADFDPALHRLARGAKRLQDVLGAYRDACDASDRLRDFARHGPPERMADRAFAVAPLIQRQREEAAEARRSFPRAWRRFERLAGRVKLRG